MYNKKTVTFAKALGITKLGHLSTDGTKTNAKASNNNSQITDVGELPESAKMCFDNCYFSAANLRYLETNGLDGYIPDSKQAHEMKGNTLKMSPFSKDSFDYWRGMCRPSVRSIRTLVANSTSNLKSGTSCDYIQ